MADVTAPPVAPAGGGLSRVVAGLVAAVLVGLAAVTAVELFRTPSRPSVSAPGDDYRASALAAAQTVAVDFTTLDYRTLTQDFQRLAKLATPSFRTAYLTQTNAAAEYIVRYKGMSSGSVVGIAVQNAGSTNAEVIAAVNDTITNTKFPKGNVQYFRLDIKLARQQGKWLVDAVDPI